MQSGANVQLVVNALDLKEAFLEWQEETHQEQTVTGNSEKYLTPDETAEMLDVSKPTLWRWEKQSYLVPVRWGSKVRYRFSDVKNCMEG